MNFQMFKLDVEKAEEPEIKLPTSTGSLKKQEFLNYAKAFDCVDHNKLWKLFKRWNIRPLYLPPEKPVCRSRSNS